MNLLLPSSLIFLSFLAIPIMFHFFNKALIKKVDFSTISFIKKLEESAIRKVEIKKWMLLLIRLLMIVMLVILFSRPVTKGFMPGWLSAEMDSKLLIVIDNSSSMSAKFGASNMLDLSKESAKLLPQAFSEKTSVDVIQTCPPKIVFSGNIKDPNISLVIDQISETVNYDNLWFVIDSLMENIRVDEAIKECVIFSDFETKSTPDDIFIKKDWKTYFIKPGGVENNLGIHNLEIISRIKVPDQLLKIKTAVKNSGKRLESNVPINLLFNDNRVGQVISEFNLESNKEFIFQAYPEEKGILSGSIQLPFDDYENDNTWYLTAPILDKINCLMIGRSDDEVSMFNLIINAIDPDKQLINFESRVQPIINRLNTEDIDLLIIHNPESITKYAYDELDLFLRDGGGLIWFAGGLEMDPSNSKYLTNLNFPRADIIVESNSGYFEVLFPSNSNHVLSDLSVRKIDKEFPECYRYIKHNYSNSHKIHLELNNEDPLLFEFKRGNGNVFYFTSLMNLAWNDIPLRGMLIPLMYRLLILGGTDEINTNPVMIGNSKMLSLNENEVRDQWEIKAPSGNKELIVPDFSKETISIDNTNELGIYNVYKNGVYFSSFSTYLNPNEFISGNDSELYLSNIFPQDSYQWIQIDNGFLDNFNKIRNGKSLWKLFLLGFIILFLLETWIGRPILKNMKR